MALAPIIAAALLTAQEVGQPFNTEEDLAPIVIRQTWAVDADFAFGLIADGAQLVPS